MMMRGYHNRHFCADEASPARQPLLQAAGGPARPCSGDFSPPSPSSASDERAARTEHDLDRVPSDLELELYEMDDQIGEMPPAFTRRQRREGLFTPSLARSARADSWATNDMLSPLRQVGGPGGVLGDQLQSGDGDFFSESEESSKGDSEDEEEDEKGFRKVSPPPLAYCIPRQYAKLILPHVGLVLLTCAYTIVGAAIFFCVENPNEKATKRAQLDIIFEKQEHFMNAIMDLVARNESGRDAFQHLASQHLHNMSDHLFVAYEKFFLTSNEVKLNKTHEIWSFSTAVFFAVTVVTTIGEWVLSRPRRAAQATETRCPSRRRAGSCASCSRCSASRSRW